MTDTEIILLFEYAAILIAVIGALSSREIGFQRKYMDVYPHPYNL